MESVSLTFSSSQSQNFSPGKGSCKSCGSANLIIKLEPPHYALRCQACGTWQSWIRKSEARRVKATAESPAFNVAPKPYKPVGESIGPAVVDTSPTNLSARVEKLERAFAGYDLQLGILVKAILSAGVLQGKGGAPEVDVDSEDVYRLAARVGRR
jgi:hypothetical protein